MDRTLISPDSRCVADILGLGSLSDGEPGMDPDLLRQLYRHARSEDGHRCLFERDASFATGWINLDSQRARELVSAFVPLDDADSLKEARRNAQNNLEAQAWNDLLGIDAPPITCKVKIHGAKWGLRFQSAEAAMRGREVLNEALPPIPAAGDASSAEATATVLPEPPDSACVPRESSAPREASDETAAADVLERGGMPA
jgi:hypothetical protein